MTTTTHSSALVADLNQADFAAEVEQSPIPVFIDFHADWCGPCKALAPVFNSLAETYAGQIRFLKVDADHNKDLTARLSVRGLPTLLLLQDGKVVERVVGSHHRAYFSDLLNKYAARPVAAAAVTARSFSAFNGDAGLRDAVIARVGSLIDAGRIKRSADTKTDKPDELRYTLLEAAVDASGEQGFEQALGIPEAVGRIEEGVHALLIEQSGEGADAQLRINAPHSARPLQWWQAIPPGADLQPLSSRFVHWFLRDLVDSSGGLPAEALAAVEVIADLHLRTARTGAVAAAEWDAARASASDLQKRLGDDEANRPARRIVEAAAMLAWPVERLENAIVDAIHSRLFADVEVSVGKVYAPGKLAESMELFKTIDETFRKAFHEKYGTTMPPRSEIEAMEEFKSGRALWAPHQNIRDAELKKVRLISGEHLHAGLMRVLADTVAAA